MAITAKDAAALRAQTGAGMMDCKKALEAANGDMDKATEILRERGVAVAAKKASRIASEGLRFRRQKDRGSRRGQLRVRLRRKDRRFP